MRRLLQIVPRVPPLIDGLGDYAHCLAAELRARTGIETLFITTDPEQRAGKDIIVLERQNSNALAKAIEGTGVRDLLLHYSGYGFDKNGIPDWLWEGLEQVGQSGRISLSVFFHELWASGRPWKKAFYLGRAQQRVVQKLQALAAHCFTSTPKMQQLLSPQALATVLPISSSISCSPREWRKTTDGPLNVVIFGQGHTRLRSWQAHAQRVEEWNKQAQIRTVTLIGQDANERSEDYKAARRIVGREKLNVCPNPSREFIGETIRSADLFLSFYPAHLVTKSSSIMAAFACGCPVLVPQRGTSPLFKPEPPLLYADDFSPQELLHRRERNQWHETAAAAFRWYEEHASWSGTVSAINGMLHEERPSVLAAL
ncbi:MAG TPA: hypothetical protein VK633_08175 [Verrucomicrobiae bacterium]|nr:hypothetical protein [Verrucomicrobiae bacterium]